MIDGERSLLLHGSCTSRPPQVPLRAGPLEAIFEAGDLRYVTLGGREVVRRIYGAVRDREWRTIPGVLSGLSIAVDEDRFLIRFQSEHREREIHLVWNGRIEGSSNGQVVFDFEGQARSSFERNRIGLCVLHPVRGYAGAAAVAHYTGGAARQVRFPDLVAVEQPVHGFSDLTGLTCDGGAIELRFEGDVFEMEDQRNWIDASFKTYSTPLSLTRPVLVREGTCIRQRVTLHARADVALRSGSAPRPRIERVGRPAGPAALPRIGLSVGAAGTWPPGAASLQPAHLRADVDLARSDWRTTLGCAAAAGLASGCPMELALTVAAASAGALDELVREWPPEVRIARVLAIAPDSPTTSKEALDLVRSAFTRDRAATVCAGSSTDLYEFHLFPPPAADGLFWAMNPHAHASDVTSLLETPAAAGDQVRTVLQRHPGALIAISPVTIRPRAWRAVVVHPLHASLLGAAWTLAMAAHLAHAGAASVTFFEQLSDTIAPDGTPYPLFHVLQDLGECAGARVVHGPEGQDAEHGDRGTPATLLLAHGARGTLLAANLSGHPTVLPLPPGFVPEGVRVLDEDTAARAVADPSGFRAQRRTGGGLESVRLAPFASARLDGHLTQVR